MNYKGYISQKVESDEIYDLCQGEKGWVDVGDIMQIQQANSSVGTM